MRPPLKEDIFVFERLVKQMGLWNVPLVHPKQVPSFRVRELVRVVQGQEQDSDSSKMSITHSPTWVMVASPLTHWA